MKKREEVDYPDSQEVENRRIALMTKYEVIRAK